MNSWLNLIMFTSRYSSTFPTEALSDVQKTINQLPCSQITTFLAVKKCRM